MLTQCKCIECEEPIKVLFDFRYIKTKQLELYVIEDDGMEPKPTGYCVDCVKQAIAKDLDLIMSKLSNKKVSVIEFRQRELYRYQPAPETASASSKPLRFFRPSSGM